ncbi:MAG: homocysteine methyltransferase [Acidobacteria bacterium]|nr:homocysteine methyltransferase [Acidobacteriota bacterium]
MTADPAPVLELIEAFRGSKTMFAAVALGVFDRLAQGPENAAGLAQELGLVPDALERLLDACVGLGLLAKNDLCYANTGTADVYLVSSSPRSLAGYVLYSNSVLYRLWSHLEDSLRDGTNRWQQEFGIEAPIFSHFFRTEEARSDFVAGMHGFGLLSSPAVVAAFDLGRFRRLVDLGGATGHLALAACREYPRLRCVVFDLPEVISYAEQYLGQAECRQRIELAAGDFFADALPAGDLYALGRIIHDWGEPKIRRLLQKIHHHLPPGGGLLLAEKLLKEDKTGPLSAQLQSLNMLVCTEGRERSLAEYAAILGEAGFQEVQGKWTGAPLDAVLAVKV